MKKLVLFVTLLLASQAALAQQICTLQTRVYVPKTVVNKYVSEKKTYEVSDWQECYAKALQEAKEYKPLQTARVQIKIFNITVSDRDRNFHFLTDWAVKGDLSSHKVTGTVNESSSVHPGSGPQAR